MKTVSLFTGFSAAALLSLNLAHAATADLAEPDDLTKEATAAAVAAAEEEKEASKSSPGLLIPVDGSSEEAFDKAWLKSKHK